MSETANKRVGDYELISHIGDGAQGKIFKARCVAKDNPNVAEGRDVALKIVRRFSEDGRSEDRFKREVRNFLSLSHPNLVSYLESFVVQDEWAEEINCLVMEFLDGEDMKARLVKDPKGLAWEFVKDVFMQCLSGLAYASENGIIHRDLKPSNIFLLKDGGVKIIDFGIAKKEDGTVTTTSGFKGTYDYMAPDFLTTGEEFRGDGLSDVFSMGVCFYQALTGRLPYASSRESGWVAYLNRWQKGQARDITISAGALRVLDDRAVAFVRKAIRVNREERYRSFTEMLEELDKIDRRSLKVGKERYVMESYMGKGGFGEVFKARRAGDGKHFAVKHMFPGLDPSRFRREARLLQKYPHPNIVGYEAYVKIDRLDGADHYLVMEFLEGMPGWGLRGRIKKDGAMSVEEVLHQFCSYLNALDFLHTAKGKPILHRDITPANLYAPPHDPKYPDRGVPKIFDMGIARSEQTMTGGHVPGNPEYMAPEFVLEPDFRGSPESDIYCLGICMFESLTGKCAYPRLSKQTAQMWTSLRERAEGKVAISFDHQVFREYPALRAIIEKAIASDRRKRYHSAAAMREALESLSLEEQTGPAPVEEDEDDDEGCTTIFVPDEAYLAAAAAGRRARTMIRVKRLVGGLAALLVIAGLAVGGKTLWEKTGELRKNFFKPDDVVVPDGDTVAELPPPPPPLPEFQPTAAYVSLIRTRLTRAEELKARAPNNPEMIEAVGGFVRQWLTMPGRFDRSFTQALDAGKTDDAAAILEQWQQIAAHLPFKDLTLMTHGRQALSMERRLRFMKGVEALRAMPRDLSEKYVAGLEESLVTVRDSRATETQPQVRSWWLRRQEDLAGMATRLGTVFDERLAGAAEAKDLAAAESLTAAWEVVKKSEQVYGAIPQATHRRVASGAARLVSGLFDQEKKRLVAACEKGDFGEAKKISRWFVECRRKAPGLVQATEPAYRQAMEEVTAQQVACVKKLVDDVSTGTKAEQFQTISDLNKEWRASWPRSRAVQLDQAAKLKCLAVANASVKLALALYANEEFAKGDDEYARLQKFSKAVPADLRPASLDDGLAQVSAARDKSTKHAQEFRDASAEFDKLAAAFEKPDPANWRKQLSSWSSLKLSVKVRESITGSAKWRDFGDKFKKAISEYVGGSQDPDCVKEVRAVLETEGSEALIDKAGRLQLTNMLKLKERVFLDRQKLARIAVSMKADKPDTWRSALKELAASRSMPSLMYDKVCWSVWKKAEGACFGHVKDYIERAEPAGMREDRLVEAQEILRSARAAGTFDIKTIGELEALAGREIGKIDAARREQARAAAKRAAELEAARLEQQRMETAKRAAELEAARLEQQRVEAAKAAAAEKKRLAELEAARLEQERLAAEKKADDEREKLKAAQRERERIAAAKRAEEEELARRKAALEAIRSRQEQERLAKLQTSVVKPPPTRSVVPPSRTPPPNRTPPDEEALSVVKRPQFDPVLQAYLEPIELHLKRDEVREAVKLLSRELIARCRKAERKKRGSVDWIRVSDWLHAKREQYPGLNVVGRNELDLVDVELEKYIARQRRGR